MARRSAGTVLVLAAGQGTRLKSKTIKLLHPVAGRQMVAWVVDAARALKPERLVAVVGFQADAMKAALGDSVDACVLQAEQRGTGHAVLQAAPALKGRMDEPLLIVNGDLPTLRSSTLEALARLHRKTKSALTLVTAELPDATGYGRIVRDDAGKVVRIVEHKDATGDEREIREINCGIYCVDPALLFPILRALRPDNAQGEYYLTDAVHRLISKGAKVTALLHDDAEEVLGVNTREELARAGITLYARKAAELMDSGVTLLDPDRVWVDPRAKVGRDTILWPDVVLEGPCVLGEDCVVRPGSRLTDVRLGDRVEIRDHCVVQDSRIAAGAAVGPFAHLRPGTELGEDVRVGNFVETKKAKLGRGSKASHLTYLGDATIGAGCNIGAGTITCNYDGVHKHGTTLEDGVFIGSDTQLVAPVRVGKGAYVGAGSTVTQDVPAGALAISRGRQRNIEGWASRRKVGKKHA